MCFLWHECSVKAHCIWILAMGAFGRLHKFACRVLNRNWNPLLTCKNHHPPGVLSMNLFSKILIEKSLFVCTFCQVMLPYSTMTTGKAKKMKGRGNTNGNKGFKKEDIETCRHVCMCLNNCSQGFLCVISLRVCVCVYMRCCGVSEPS